MGSDHDRRELHAALEDKLGSRPATILMEFLPPASYADLVTRDEFRAGMAELGGRIDRLDGRIDRLDGRIDGLDGRIDGLAGKIDGLLGRSWPPLSRSCSPLPASSWRRSSWRELVSEHRSAARSAAPSNNHGRAIATMVGP